MLDELRDLYQEVILDHGKRPRNLRHPPESNRQAHGHNPMCGDQLTVYLVVNPDGIVRDVAFEGKGCAISVASASIMTEILKGKTEVQARVLFSSLHALCTGEDDSETEGPEQDPSILAGLGEELERVQVLAGVRQFPVRVKCATLAWHTMIAAIDGDEIASTE
ncbi:MAG: Fe-S cluster assembly sulfur transfer protein SufU [Alphaproteobacteria bacterium]